MKPRRFWRTLAISALGVLAVVAFGLCWRQYERSRVRVVAYKPLPAGQAFLDAVSSPHFRVHGTVTLRHQEPQTPDRRVLTFQVLIENKTDEPIRGLLVTGELSDALGPYDDPQLQSYAHWPTFGSLDNPVDLLPGQVPYGYVPAKAENLLDPYAMTAAERQQFYAALRQPIRLGLWWQGGEEFLELRPSDIDYVGFP